MVQALAAVQEKREWQRLGSACLLHWHLCSLDAPTVAVVWAMALARLAAVRLQTAELLVLGLGTWIVYVLDRVLDGQGARASRSAQSAQLKAQRLQERHHFHRRHQAVLLSLCAVAATTVALLCRDLPMRLVAFYLLLGLPVAAYGASVHGGLIRGWLPAWFQGWLSAGLSRQGGRRPGMQALPGKHPERPRTILGSPKEAAVATLFTAAVAAPALAGAHPAARPALLPAALLLVMLCWLNCALISHAEAPVLPDRQAKRIQLTAAIMAIAVICTVLWACAELGSPAIFRLPDGVRSAPIAAAGLLSCMLLLSLLLGLRDGPAGARRLRILADVGLLTPLIFLLPHP